MSVLLQALLSLKTISNYHNIVRIAPHELIDLMLMKFVLIFLVVRFIVTRFWLLHCLGNSLSINIRYEGNILEQLDHLQYPWMLYQFRAMQEESKSQAFACFSLLVQFKTI
jgi:hypothetical protein